jgi:hypothetical protein
METASQHRSCGSSSSRHIDLPERTTPSPSSHLETRRLHHLVATALTQLSILPAMSSSDNNGSSSRNWNDVLKHGSALSILKPDVAFPPYGGGSSSGGSSSSTSGGTSGGTSGDTTYPSGGVSHLSRKSILRHPELIVATQRQSSGSTTR